MTTPRPRALEVDLLRFLAIAAMFTLHVAGTWRMVGAPGPWSARLAQLVHDACQMCVPVLFLLSFFLMARRRAEEPEVPVARWLAARLRELLPPTVVWAVVYSWLGGELRARGLWAVWFARYHVGPLHWTSPVMGTHLWYMVALLQLVVLFPGVYWLVERVTRGRPSRAQALLAAVLVLKAALCWGVFLPRGLGLSEWRGWVGLFGPYWLDLMLFAILWNQPEALQPERPTRQTRLGWWSLLAFTVVIDASEVRRLVASGLSDLEAHSNWRFGNALYGMGVFAVVLSHREQLARLVPGRVARWLQHFNQEYAFAFYLAHVLGLTLAANVQVSVLHLGPAASLGFLLLTSCAGTLGLLWVLRRVPFVGPWLGLRRGARAAELTPAPVSPAR